MMVVNMTLDRRRRIQIVLFGRNLIELDGVDGIDAPVELLHRQVPAGVPQHRLLSAGGELLRVAVVADASHHGLKNSTLFREH